MGEISLHQRVVLSRVPDDDAYWTSDIAWDARKSTSSTHTALRRLQERGLVEAVAGGGGTGPRSWRRTDAGRAEMNCPRTEPATRGEEG
jgi:hypothetical protein